MGRWTQVALSIGIPLVAALASAAAAGDGITDTELAGKLLNASPHFQYVSAIHSDTKIYLAADPTRFPELQDRTCDVHIVESRDAPGWAQDATLVDVSAGGAQPVSFVGTTIQSNRFLIGSTGELDDDAGAGLGVGYDVVLDCNRNGSLDSGDFIDGRGDESGFYAVRDTTLPGPLAVSEIDYSDGVFLTQNTFYPTDIAALGRLPLVVISHGWTHNYGWYDHIGNHLASYGYIVMSHRNNVGAGGPGDTTTASTTTLTNTDHILEHQGTIAGGVLDGHIDNNRIVWIGHSTGGEGVVRAYTRLRQGSYVPDNYTADDIVLLAPIAPVAWLNITEVNPHDVNFHMFAGAADTDTSNGPDNQFVQLLSIYERAVGNKTLVYVHSAGHAHFHNGNQPTTDWATGPDLLTREATHEVMRGYYLPLVELYARGNPAGRDYFARMDDDFRPPGIDSNIVLATEYRNGDAAQNFAIDDFQVNSATDTSSSGGSVMFDVSNVSELLMRDQDGSFDWTGSQPSNGMTRSRFSGDDERCVVFDWTGGGPAFYELELVPAQRDLTDDGFLSFRAAQGTRHPETVALDGPLFFSVTLRDGNGVESSIAVSHYGEITRPYQRTGAGSGTGWANEFSTVRLRLSDFLNDANGLDLSDIVAIRFELGAAFGSARGRIGLDDIELTDRAPAPPFVLTLDKTAGTFALRWPASPRAVAFHVYRGTLPAGGLGQRGSGGDVYDHTCYDASDTAGDGPFLAEDPTSVPVDRAGFYYLVSVVTQDGEGSLGDAGVDLDPVTPGSQPQRPNANPCP